MSDETSAPKAGPQMVFIGGESAAALLAALDASARERRLWEEEEAKRYTERHAKADAAQAEYSGYLRLVKEHLVRQTCALESIAISLGPTVTTRRATRKKRKAVGK